MGRYLSVKGARHLVNKVKENFVSSNEPIQAANAGFADTAASANKANTANCDAVGNVIHQHNRVPRTSTGSGGTKVGHALFLGAQAAVFAEGEAPRWEEDTFDYGDKCGFSFGRIFGISKTQFKYDGTNLTDFGCINILTASEDDV